MYKRQVMVFQCSCRIYIEIFAQIKHIRYRQDNQGALEELAGSVYNQLADSICVQSLCSAQLIAYQLGLHIKCSGVGALSILSSNSQKKKPGSVLLPMCNRSLTRVMLQEKQTFTLKTTLSPKHCSQSCYTSSPTFAPYALAKCISRAGKTQHVPTRICTAEKIEPKMQCL